MTHPRVVLGAVILCAAAFVCSDAQTGARRRGGNRGCKYERRSDVLSECEDGKQVMTVALIRGDEGECEATSERVRRCRSTGTGTRVRGCRYGMPVVGECDENGVQTVTRGLKTQRSPEACEPQKVKTRPCGIEQRSNTNREDRRAAAQERKQERKEQKMAAKAEQQEKKAERREQRQAQMTRRQQMERGKVIKQQAIARNGFYTCQYERGVESECQDGVISRLDRVIPGSSKDCSDTVTYTIPCDQPEQDAEGQ